MFIIILNINIINVQRDMHFYNNSAQLCRNAVVEGIDPKHRVTHLLIPIKAPNSKGHLREELSRCSKPKLVDSLEKEPNFNQ